MNKNYALVFIWIILSMSFSAVAQPWMQASMLSATSDQKENPKNFHDIQRIFEDYWKDKNPAAEEEDNGRDWGYQQFKRWEWFMKPRTYPSGEMFDPEILFREYQNQKSIQRRMNIHPAVTNANWTSIGPNVVPSSGGGIGRINTVRFDPTDVNIVYAGSANGGLWKSTVGGGSWTTFTDLLPALGIADIAINPRYHDSIFVATGDRDGYELGNDFWGGTYSAGVLVSPDGGVTWNATGLNYVQTQSQVIHRLLINSNNPNIVLAASRTGIYRTTNAGVTWTMVQSGNVIDMEFKPGDPNTVYACTSTNLYKSTNSGANWTLSYNGLGGGGGAIIAVTDANPQVVYSLNGNFVIKKSTDGGSTFTTLTSPVSTGVISDQGFYDCALAVSPTDENFVLVGAQATPGVQNAGGIAKSTNGGSTWAAIASTVHCDHHDLQFAPGSGTTIYNTNDGGIFKSTTSGSTWSNIGAGIVTKQYYRIGASAITPYYMYAGAQDNGTDMLKNTLWKHVYGGDGMDCLIDYTNDNVAYVSYQYTAFGKTTNGGTSFTNMTMPGTGDWTTPLVMDPINHNTLYLGLSDLYKSNSAGGSWAAISAGQFGGTINCIAVAPSDVNYIYASTLGRICRTTNGGTTWTNVSSGLPLASTGITWITVSSLDPLKIWVTLTAYVAGQKVYYSSNGGSSWTNISGTLPNVPANCITYQANSQDAVYLGTDFGVYYRDATMIDWIPYMTGLPNVTIDELEIQYGSINKIRAATYGRGIWESDLNNSSTFALDAGMVNILSPTSVRLCDTTFVPQVTIRNFGQTTITSLDINYQVDALAPQVYNWVGSLATNATATVTLPATNAPSGNHSFTVFTSNPNASPDDNSFNDSRTTTFDIDTNVLSVPVTEGFETSTFPPVTWTLSDPGSFILRFTSAGGFGNSIASMKARCFAATNSYATFTSSQIDFSSLLNPATLTFSLAYAMRSASSHDSLRILVSTDCGVTYTQVYSKTGNALATVPIHAANYTPVAADWRSEWVDLSSFIGQSHVQIQFVLYGDFGNNIYLDDINIFDATTGLHNLTNESAISVFPNPTNGEVTFNFGYQHNDNVNIEIYDVIGNKVAELNSQKPVKGNSIVMDLHNQPSGMYFYRVMDAGNKIKEGKLIKM
jgi:photosystem II stability/assembly factor-like uncharacterized protein